MYKKIRNSRIFFVEIVLPKHLHKNKFLVIEKLKQNTYRFFFFFIKLFWIKFCYRIYNYRKYNWCLNLHIVCVKHAHTFSNDWYLSIGHLLLARASVRAWSLCINFSEWNCRLINIFLVILYRDTQNHSRWPITIFFRMPYIIAAFVSEYKNIDIHTYTENERK